MKKLLSSLLLFWFVVGMAFAEQPYQEITPPHPVSVSSDKVEVLEFFWYGCPHCYQFEPHIQQWLENKPENVEFVRVPAIFRPSWSAHARAYYAARLLGVEKKFSAALFDALHKQRKRIYSQKQLLAFAGSIGINKDDFKEAMASFAVETKIRRARQLVKDYGVTGVPTVIVNGKYKTDAVLAHGHQQVIEVINRLVAKESAGK